MCVEVFTCTANGLVFEGPSGDSLYHENLSAKGASNRRNKQVQLLCFLIYLVYPATKYSLGLL